MLSLVRTLSEFRPLFEEPGRFLLIRSEEITDKYKSTPVHLNATNLRDLELPMLLPGIKVNTSPTDYYAVRQLQLMRFDDKRWVRFGDLLYGE